MAQRITVSIKIDNGISIHPEYESQVIDYLIDTSKPYALTNKVDSLVYETKAMILNQIDDRRAMSEVDTLAANDI